jgi:integrase
LKAGRTEARETSRIQPVPDEHVDAVLSAVSPQVAAMIELQRKTGARAGEVVLIRPCDVDVSGRIWIYRPPSHKTQYLGRVREILLGPEAQRILRPWLDRPAEAYCFSPAEAEAARNAARRAARRTPMTPSQATRKPKSRPKRPKRDRYTVDAYRRAIKYGIAKTGTPHWHPHQLRHSFGTRARSKFGLDVAQKLLGHASANTTEIYAEADRVQAASAIRRLG